MKLDQNLGEIIFFILATIGIIYTVFCMNDCAKHNDVLINQTALECIGAYKVCITQHEESTCSRTLEECK